MANGVAVVFDVRVSGHAHNAADHPFAQMRAGNTDDGEVPALVSDDDDDTTTSLCGCPVTTPQDRLRNRDGDSVRIFEKHIIESLEILPRSRHSSDGEVPALIGDD